MTSAQLEAINTKLKKLDLIDTVLEKLDRANLKIADISADIATLKTTVGKNHEVCLEKCKELDKKIDNNFDSWQKSLELVINGVPSNVTLNVNAIYKAISAVIGFSDDLDTGKLPPRVNAFRIGTNKEQILLRFGSLLEKEDYLGSYYPNAKELTLHKIGITTGADNRIYIQHNFTPQQYSVFKLAVSKKKAKTINSIRVKNGSVVMVRVKAESKFIPVNNADEIEAAIQNSQ